MNKYEKLTMDLTEALKKAREAVVNLKDEGTCNFDSCLLYLPGYNESKTLSAINLAGTIGYKDKHFGKVCFMLAPPIMAQGFVRTAQAETIRDAMKEKGYDAEVYYMMD